MQLGRWGHTLRQGQLVPSALRQSLRKRVFQGDKPFVASNLAISEIEDHFLEIPNKWQ
jgi:hypothetical protein